MAHKYRWALFFDVMDQDGNGVLEKRDIDALAKQLSERAKLPVDDPDIKGVTFAYSSLLNNVIENFDENNDGKVTIEEFFAGVERYFVGKTPETIPHWLKKCIEDFFPSYDTNKDGEISLEELKVGFKLADPDQTDENITKAFEWAKSHSPSGKYDFDAFYNVAYLWATSKEEVPEVVTLTPYFRKRIVIWGKLYVKLY